MPTPEALGWWALQFTPRVVWIDEGLLMEVSACERLWGGLAALRLAISAQNPAPAPVLCAQGATSLIALARLRMFALRERPPADLPGALPLHTLTAARDHLFILERMGCRTWGDVARLPRAGLSRRFGTPLREALDIAWGLRPDRYRWLELPESFDQKIELPALATHAPALLWSAARLLQSLQFWLRARQRGVRALELEWTLDLRRIDGVELPPTESLLLRTAEPMQDMGHLKRLLGERLAHVRMAAPASWLRLRTLDTAPWIGASTSFLPEDSRKGDRLHELVERLGARLGVDKVLAPVLQADHRPEAMQRWCLARDRLPAVAAAARAGMRSGTTLQPDALYPPWLLPAPLRLEVEDHAPCYRGPLQMLAGPQRLETGWWTAIPGAAAPPPAVRDYYIAESPGAGLVWVFRERRHSRSDTGDHADSSSWFLHGLYA